MQVQKQNKTLNLINEEFLVNPYPTYSYLRESGPIHWTDEFFGGSWILPRYADVANALNDTRLSAQRGYLSINQYPPEIKANLAEFDRLFSMWVLFLDPPQHTHLREPIVKGFTQVVRDVQPRIQEKVNMLLKKAKEGHQMEFMSNFAHILPVLVTADFLGVEESDQNEFIKWSDKIAVFFGNPQSSQEVAYEAQDSLIAMTKYFRDLIPYRRNNMGNDLFSLLLKLEEQGEILSTEELLAQCSCFLFAGHETTRNLLGTGLFTLLQHPEQLSMLKNNPSLMRNALKELLRYESPSHLSARIAAEDFTLHGQQIKKGQFVVLIVGSANRDPAVFPNPDTFDITRTEINHLSFGVGRHFCIGAPLAYLESEIAFNTIFQRFPNLQLVDDTLDWNKNVSFRGLNTLMLSF